jgi:hypothetical protein
METEGAVPTASPCVDAAPSFKKTHSSEPIRLQLMPSAPSGVVADPTPPKRSLDEVMAQADLPDVPLRFSEKRRLHWSDKTCTSSRSGAPTLDK